MLCFLKFYAEWLVCNIERKLSEALYIQKIKPTLNVKKKISNLNSTFSYFYKALIVLIKMLGYCYFDMTFCCSIIILDNLYLTFTDDGEWIFIKILFLVKKELF